MRGGSLSSMSDEASDSDVTSAWPGTSSHFFTPCRWWLWIHYISLGKGSDKLESGNSTFSFNERYEYGHSLTVLTLLVSLFKS
jgi:hypothetical protein